MRGLENPSGQRSVGADRCTGSLDARAISDCMGPLRVFRQFASLEEGRTVIEASGMFRGTCCVGLRVRAPGASEYLNRVVSEALSHERVYGAPAGRARHPLLAVNRTYSLDCLTSRRP